MYFVLSMPVQRTFLFFVLLYVWSVYVPLLRPEQSLHYMDVLFILSNNRPPDAEWFMWCNHQKKSAANRKHTVIVHYASGPIIADIKVVACAANKYIPMQCQMQQAARVRAAFRFRSNRFVSEHINFVQ